MGLVVLPAAVHPPISLPGLTAPKEEREESPGPQICRNGADLSTLLPPPYPPSTIDVKRSDSPSPSPSPISAPIQPLEQRLAPVVRFAIPGPRAAAIQAQATRHRRTTRRLCIQTAAPPGRPPRGTTASIIGRRWCHLTRAHRRQRQHQLRQPQLLQGHCSASAATLLAHPSSLVALPAAIETGLATVAPDITKPPRPSI